MSNIWLTSDTHFGHDRDFIWGVRGFSSCKEMNEELVNRWNSVVQPEDEVWHLGDVMLGEEDMLKYVKQLNGTIHVIRGNHDTDRRVKLLETLPNISEIKWGDMQVINGYHLFMSHYPTMTEHPHSKKLRSAVINLFGHSHQQTNFFRYDPKDRRTLNPFMYHVGVDSHNCFPVLLETALEDMRRQKSKMYPQ